MLRQQSGDHFVLLHAKRAGLRNLDAGDGKLQIQMPGASTPDVIPVDSADGTNTLSGLAPTSTAEPGRHRQRRHRCRGRSPFASEQLQRRWRRFHGLERHGRARIHQTGDGRECVGDRRRGAHLVRDQHRYVRDSGRDARPSSAPPAPTWPSPSRPDTTQISGAINTFVSSYNAVVQAINAQYAVDSNSQQGVLASDSTLSSIQSTLASDVNFSGTGQFEFINLASMGISMNDDGTLSRRFDNTQFVDHQQLSGLSSIFSELD